LAAQDCAEMTITVSPDALPPAGGIKDAESVAHAPRPLSHALASRKPWKSPTAATNWIPRQHNDSFWDRSLLLVLPMKDSAIGRRTPIMGKKFVTEEFREHRSTMSTDLSEPPHSFY
jgi:hypothetical protein